MLLHPVGPLPAGTYWVRRTVVVATLVVAVILSASWLGGGGNGSPDHRAGGGQGSSAPVGDATSTTSSAIPDPAPAAVTAPTAKSPPTAGPVVAASPAACASRSLSVTASTDARTYPTGVRPLLTMTVKNVGPVSCLRDLGVGARGMTIRSGSDRIWSSNDCEGSGTALMTLAPGEKRSYAVRWSRLRSHRGCLPPGPQGRPGTYRLYTTVGTATSPPAVFSLR